MTKEEIIEIIDSLRNENRRLLNEIDYVRDDDFISQSEQIIQENWEQIEYLEDLLDE